MNHTASSVAIEIECRRVISSSGRMEFFLKQTVLLIVILMLLCICFAESLEASLDSEANPSPSGSYTRRQKRFFSCRDLRLICPTQEQYFVVRSKWEWRRLGCRLQESVLDKAIKECDIGPMDQCKDKWLEKNNNCSVKVIVLKQILDHVFHPACTLHDLCYGSLNASRDDCDKWFFHNLKQICSIKKLTRIFCEGTIRAMHKAVRWFGKKFFKEGQAWAKENCTSSETLPVSPPKSSIEGSGSKGGGFSGSGIQSGSAWIPVVPETIDY